MQTRLDDVLLGRNPSDPFAAKPEIGESLRQGRVKFQPADEPAGEPTEDSTDTAPDRSQEKDNY